MRSTCREHTQEKHQRCGSTWVFPHANHPQVVLPTNARKPSLLTCVCVIHTDSRGFSQLRVCVLMHTTPTYTGSGVEEKKERRATWHQILALRQYFSTTTLITIYTLECVQENITTPQHTEIQKIWKDRKEQSLGFIQHSKTMVLKIPACILITNLDNNIYHYCEAGT